MPIRRADSRFRRCSFFLTVVFPYSSGCAGIGQIHGASAPHGHGPHAVVNNAKVTVTNESTSIATLRPPTPVERRRERAAPRELRLDGALICTPEILPM